MSFPSLSQLGAQLKNAAPVLSEKFQAFVSKFQKKSAPKTQVRTVIGLDIGRAYFNIAQIQKIENQVTLQKYVHHQILPNIPVAAQLKNLFQESGITEKRVRVSLKGQGVILRFISFPKMSRTEFESSIQFEAEKYLPFAMSEVVLDFFIIETPKSESKSMDVILVAARKQEVQKLIKTIQEAELEPESIDVDAIAFTNAFVFSKTDSKEKVYALVDFGAKDVNLNIVEKGKLRFSRDITFGGYDIAQFLKRRLQIDDKGAFAIQNGEKLDKPEYAAALKESFGALIQEIKLSINYFYGQHPDTEPLSGIFVSGGLAKVDLLRQTISNELKLEVLEWDPSTTIQISPQIDKKELESNKLYLPVCLGIALK